MENYQHELLPLGGIPLGNHLNGMIWFWDCHTRLIGLDFARS